MNLIGTFPNFVINSLTVRVSESSDWKWPACSFTSCLFFLIASTWKHIMVLHVMVHCNVLQMSVTTPSGDFTGLV